jgi:hypothetical protein
LDNKLQISFVQPNFRQGPGGIAAYLPYSCGLLWAHAQTNEIVKNGIKLHRIIYNREPLNELAIELSKMDIVGFSTYVWNRNYNFTLAKKIKEINPNVLVIFGGPEPPITDSEIFTKWMPFADLVVKSEGEFIFTKVLESRALGRWYDLIPGLLINVNGGVLNTGNAVRIETLDDVPSPYLTGVFDDIMPLENEWNGTLETNRGCPYKCTFCDWGSLTYSKVKQFGLTRVFHELEWMADNKIGYLDVADANFGIFVERDNMIVDKLIEVQKRTGYPYRTGWSWAKNQKSEVVAIAKKLINSGHFNNGLTISLQSLDENTLKTIKRSNLGINKISDIFEECRMMGVPLNTELIIGLPGETLESWIDTMFGVLEVGQHDSIEAWQAQILENAEMNLSQRESHNIRGQYVYDYFPNASDDEAPEHSEIVVSTSTMDINEMIEAYKLSWFLITWHTGGFSQIVARFIRKYKGDTYKEFYTKFREFLQSDLFWKEEEDTLSEIMMNWFDKGERIDTTLGPVRINASTNQYRTLFRVHSDEKYEHMYELLSRFIDTYKLPIEITQDLMMLNKCVVAEQRNLIDYSFNMNYNLLEYIIDMDSELKGEETTIKITYPHDPIRSKDLAWFMESLFFARRRSFGKNFLETIK